MTPPRFLTAVDPDGLFYVLRVEELSRIGPFTTAADAETARKAAQDALDRGTRGPVR